MKKDVYLRLNEFADRPIIQLHEHKYLTALLDTGARFPVWTASTKLLEAHGGNATKSRGHTIFTKKPDKAFLIHISNLAQQFSFMNYCSTQITPTFLICL